MSYSRNKLRRLRYSLKSNCNRLSKKLYAIDEAVLCDYIKREDSYIPSEYSYLKAPNKHPLRDARLRFNDLDESFLRLPESHSLIGLELKLLKELPLR